MQKYYNKKRKLNKLKASLLLLMMVCFAGVATAQTRANDIRMKTGTVEITDLVVYSFYDSGGPNIVDPEEDPNNDVNWASMYSHNESYLLHLSNPLAQSGKGIEIAFNYLLVNDDHLKIYEGDLENPDNLIVDLTSNAYSTGYGNTFRVMSHGNMTIRFESNGQYRDLGWDASVELADYEDYAPCAPVALMEACESNIVLLPGSKASGNSAITKMYYNINNESDPVPGDPLTGVIEYQGAFELTSVPATIKTVLTENGIPSQVATYTFTSLITPPDEPTITREAGTNNFNIDAHWHSDINDTYYIQYTTDGSDPKYAPASQQLVCSERGANGSWVNKINTVTMNQLGKLRVVTRGTTCPDLFSEEASESVTTVYVPMPVIAVNGTGATGTAEITCSLPDAVIYYTLDGSDPTTSTTTYGTSPVNLSSVPAGTTIKAMAAHSGSGYENSAIASAIYIPGGQGGGVYGDVDP